jgi:hypothetical protein
MTAKIDVPIEPIVVRPGDACVMIRCGLTHLYQLMDEGELVSFLDGASRKITVDSIKRYIARRVGGKSERRRPGRPRKQQQPEAPRSA